MLVFDDEGSLAFNGLTQDWATEKSDHKNIDLPEEEPKREDKMKFEDKKAEVSESWEEEEKIRRQIGDSTLWTYYFKTIGTVPLITVVLVQVIATIGGLFPRESFRFAIRY
jgi:hypothetical protein